MKDTAVRYYIMDEVSEKSGKKRKHNAYYIAKGKFTLDYNSRTMFDSLESVLESYNYLREYLEECRARQSNPRAEIKGQYDENDPLTRVYDVTYELFIVEEKVTKSIMGSGHIGLLNKQAEIKRLLKIKAETDALLEELGAELSCENCSNPGESLHTCPYKEDISGDSETLCNCCGSCQYSCRMDI